MAAAAAADALGIAPDVIVRALSAFPGVRRRFEIIEDGDVTFVDDYAHHPHAVALTVAAARKRFPGRRLIAAFQPTLFTRLHRFLEPFAAAFDEADEAIVVEIQPSRERDTGLDPRQRSRQGDCRPTSLGGPRRIHPLRRRLRRDGEAVARAAPARRCLRHHGIWPGQPCDCPRPPARLTRSHVCALRCSCTVNGKGRGAQSQHEHGNEYE